MSARVRLGLAFVAALLCWFAANRAQARALDMREAWGPADDFMLVMPPKAAPLLTAGYSELAADITWVRMLVYYGSAKIGKSDFRYLETLIDNVIALDPRFEKVYMWAAGAVTYRQERATQEEFRTSVKYLRKGIEAFPDDYDLRHALAMKLWWDLHGDPDEMRKNRREAARVAEEAMRLPSAPPAAATLISAMWGELGELEHARQTLRQMLLTTENKQARAKMIERFKQIASAREAELIAKAKLRFDQAHAENLPWGPSDLYVLLGERPKRWPTLDELAGQTLFAQVPSGASESDEADDEEADDEEADDP